MKMSNINGLVLPQFPKHTELLELPDCYTGIEIEVEGLNCVTYSHSDYWEIKGDGSLRNEGKEVVLRQPTAGQDLINALDELDTIIDSNNADYSARTSVHVHIDIRDMTVEQLFNMLFFYIYCEKALFNYVGHNREDSNYCIPWWKTEELKKELYVIYSSMKEDRPQVISRTIDTAMNKYSALNLRVINTFGSVEFRHHYGTHDKNRILEWVNILMSLKRQAMTIDHQHLEFEQLLNEHFVTPTGLEEAMTETVTHKGMAFLNEIYHDCRLHEQQEQERNLLKRLHLRGRLVVDNYRMLDKFNEARGLRKLRAQRRDNDNLDDNDVAIFTGGSVILEDVLEPMGWANVDPSLTIPSPLFENASVERNW